MKNNRILSYHLSQKLTEKDIQAISGGNHTTTPTHNATNSSEEGIDISCDISSDA